MALRKKFQAETRDCFGTNEMHRLRRGGRVPGVVYGPGEETVPISVDQHDISHLLDTITVENTLIDLSVTGSV
ncbi:MAG: 50S ribosomal protein L25, partial [Gemmatimonadota bacterium]|nr:50S ribosomal protein L25 [Gemmatimonadota bacterium]